MWQKQFDGYEDRGFTVVGLALEVEGVSPAKLYYEKHKITFPALVDPNYATGFGAVPKTFFIDEHGVVQELSDWERRLQPTGELEPVTEEIRRQWTDAGARLEPASIARSVEEHQAQPADLATVVELASRYLDLSLHAEAKSVLQTALRHHAPPAREQVPTILALTGKHVLRLGDVPVRH